MAGYFIDRQYVLKAISRLGITMLTVQELKKIAELTPTLKSCTLVPFIGTSGFSSLDDKNNLGTFNGIFAGYCKELVYDTPQKPAVVRAEGAIWLLSMYYHYEAVAYPATVYELISFCLRVKILF